MRLTDELFEKGKNSKDICIYLNDDYVLINKTMPIEDSKLEEYVDSIKKLKESGVNISSILDYRLIDGTTSSYNDGISYTKGVFLEERAKGDCIAETKPIYLEKNNEYDLDRVIDEYLKQNEEYLSKLEVRANANQEIYDKLVQDCLSLDEYNLTVDPKPLNFFFDKEKGYTIIDVIPSYQKERDNEYFSKYIFNVVFGYSKPFIYIDYPGINSLPSEMHQRYDKCIENLNIKIVRALKNNNINEEFIKRALLDNSKKMVFSEDKSKEELYNYIKQRFEEKNNESKEESSSLIW